MTHLRLPPAIGNVLVPVADRRSFVAGLSLWSATSRRARLIQRGYRLLAEVVGPGRVLGHRTQWDAPLPADLAGDHRSAWQGWFGRFSQVAVYQPAQQERSGFAVLLLEGGHPVGFVKCRPDWKPDREVAVVQSVSGADTFGTPEVVGVHPSGGWTSVGFTALPGTIHSPILRVPVGPIVDEISRLLEPVIGRAPEGWVPMHGDLGPWNLRQLPSGEPVVFDWEYAASGPPRADAVFHAAASQALGLPVATNLAGTRTARDFWVEEIERRFSTGARDERLARAMIEFLLDEH